MVFFSHEQYARFSERKSFIPLVFLLALALMVSALVPFEVVLIPLVTVKPKRWKEIIIASVLGSAFGAMSLAALFRHIGWPILDQFFPALATTHGWSVAQAWISKYGFSALIPIAALPMAQAPAIAISGLLQVNVFRVLEAYIIGKFVKYTVIAWLTIKSETSIKEHYNLKK